MRAQAQFECCGRVIPGLSIVLMGKSLVSIPTGGRFRDRRPLAPAASDQPAVWCTGNQGRKARCAASSFPEIHAGTSIVFFAGGREPEPVSGVANIPAFRKQSHPTG